MKTGLGLNKGNEKGFSVFLGIVTEIESDEHMLGRMKIRNISDFDEEETPDEDLPWATPIMPMTSASLKGKGTSPTWVDIGTYVVGFYLDGQKRQVPMILGTFNKIPGMDLEQHDVNALARETNNIEKELLGPEPEPAYAAKYPHNKVIATNSAVIELDDTPENERIHIWHKSGSYTEINKDGRTVRKSANNDYTVVAGDSEMYVDGKVNIHITGDANLKVEGKFAADIGGTAEFKSGGNMSFKAPRIDLNEG